MPRLFVWLAHSERRMLFYGAGSTVHGWTVFCSTVPLATRISLAEALFKGATVSVANKTTKPGPSALALFATPTDQ